MVGRFGDLQDRADIGNGLALDGQLISRFELVDDLLRRVAGSFHGGVSGPVWPDKDSHSPCIDFWGPRHQWMQSPSLRRVDRTTSTPSLKQLWELNGIPADLAMEAVQLNWVLGYR